MRTSDLPPSGWLEGRTHVLPVRVYYEDTDSGGIVYNASYLRYAERARTEKLRLVGFDHRGLEKNAEVALAVRHLEVDFLKPARLDDVLTVRTEARRVRAAAIELDQDIFCDGTAICRLVVTVVCMSLRTGRAVRLPKEVRAAFEDRIMERRD